MSKKYVIEINPEYEDTTKGVMVLGARESNLFVDTLAVENLEELNSDYINEHYGELKDDAYKRGLEDAWGAARKIVRMPEGDLLNIFTECYSAVCTALQVLLKYDTSEAIAKLKAYEEKQKADSEIKVGDEVYAYTPSGKTRPFVIIKIYDEDGVKYYSGINADGNHVQGGLNYIKTGRHFPHVAELLKEMQS